MLQVQLYDYQKEMKQRIDDALEHGLSVMVQMPTGTGKTYLLASVVESFVQSDSQSIVWIIAHRKELVAQIERTISHFGISVSHQRPEDFQVRVYSIQWLSKNLKKMTDKPSLIVVDEAHHALAKTYSAVLDSYPTAHKLGMTATPCRLNGKGFLDLFDTLLTAASINTFIKNGYLSPFDYVSIPSDSVEISKIDSLVKRSVDGDYNVAEMSAVLDTRPSIERLYLTIADYAHDKKGIVYAINIEHANHIAEYYNEQGLNAKAISSKTSDKERELLVKDFTEGRLQILVNVDIFSEGFDCPDVEFIQMARPTLSLAKYLQQVGRGLRVFEGKKCCILLDNVGLYRLFGLPTEGWNWQAMFQGRERGKGEVSNERIACMNLFPEPMQVSSETTPDNQTEMVVLTRHEELQEKIELFRIISQLGCNKGMIDTLPKGWITRSVYIQRGNPHKVYKRTGSRNFGRELVQDAKGFYYTFQERKEELVFVGKNAPWATTIDAFIKNNPHLLYDSSRKLSIRHTEYIWKPRILGTDDIHVFKGGYFLGQGKNAVTDNNYSQISKADEGVRVYKTDNGTFGVMNQDGTHCLLWGKAYIEYLSDGIAYVRENIAGVRQGRWINLFTMQEFAERPEVVKFGFVRTLKVGELYYLLEARKLTGIPLKREDFVFNDSVFLFYENYVILKDNPKTILYLDKSYRRDCTYKLTDISINGDNTDFGYISITKLPQNVSVTL